jgi:hypothetical protein
MSEIRWCFGYRCEIGPSCIVEGGWIGVVYAPIWHPIRSLGLDEFFVLKISDDWIVCIDTMSSFYKVSNKCWSVASTLRRMQDDWDRFSPYEREYRIW